LHNKEFKAISISVTGKTDKLSYTVANENPQEEAMTKLRVQRAEMHV